MGQQVESKVTSTGGLDSFLLMHSQLGFQSPSPHSPLRSAVPNLPDNPTENGVLSLPRHTALFPELMMSSPIAQVSVHDYRPQSVQAPGQRDSCLC